MKEQKARKASATPVKRTKASLILGILSAVSLILTAVGIWLMREYLSDPELVRERIGDHYVIGAIAVILICAVQVIVALIPGEVVEIAAGYVFGSWGGALLCITGIVLGSSITILLVRKFGAKFVYAFYPKEKIDALPIINDPPKRNILTFILFAIPGTPKDLFTYAIGLTNMSIPLYIALTTAARFPSVILSTYSGGALGDKDYSLAIIFVIITAVVSGVGLLVYRSILKRRRRSKDADASNEPNE